MASRLQFKKTTPSLSEINIFVALFYADESLSSIGIPDQRLKDLVTLNAWPGKDEGGC
jgi:hypothetical protein